MASAKYLTSTTVSPLMEAFVNVAQPLSSDVDMDFYDFGQPAFAVSFENVPVERMNEVEPKFMQILDKIVADGPDKLNMDRIKTFSE